MQIYLLFLRGEDTLNLKVLIMQPGSSYWKEFNFTCYEEVMSLIGGRLYCLHLTNDIDLWMRHPKCQEQQEENICIVDPVEDYTKQLFGSIFMVGHGKNGGSVSLSQKQIEWIRQHTQITKEEKQLNLSEPTYLVKGAALCHR